MPRSVVYREDVSAPGIVTPESACQTSLRNLQKDSEKAREREKWRERESESAGGWW
jgi:predicted lysophospholipase L1 biosynthesis ABC-type transport system permease subunit